MNENASKGLERMDKIMSGVDRLMEKLDSLAAKTEKTNQIMDKQVYTVQKIVKNAKDVGYGAKEANEIMTNALKSIGLKEFKYKLSNDAAGIEKDMSNLIEAFDKYGKNAEKFLDSIKEMASGVNVDNMVKNIKYIDEEEIEDFVNIFKNVHPKGDINDFKDQIYDFLKLRQRLYEDQKKYGELTVSGFDGMNKSQLKEAARLITEMAGISARLNKIYNNNSKFSKVFTTENGLNIEGMSGTKASFGELREQQDEQINFLLASVKKRYQDAENEIAAEYKEMHDAILKGEKNIPKIKLRDLRKDVIPSGKYIPRKNNSH